MRPRKSKRRVCDVPIDVEVLQPERTRAFREEHEREAGSTAWGFPVVWHAQRHQVAALRDDEIVGVLELHIAASLAHVASLIVAPAERRRGTGRALLERAEALAKYYNCHKVTLEVPASGVTRTFFEACGYRLEAVLPQHTWKRDVAILRKFLL